MKATIQKTVKRKNVTGAPPHRSTRQKKADSRDDHLLVDTHCRLCGRSAKAPIGYLVLCSICVAWSEPPPP